TTYTFTPLTGQCAIPTQLTINVNSILNVSPSFNAVAAICIGDTLTALATTSLNNINGTWSPALNNQLTTTYTFLPNPGQNANTTTLTITVNVKTIPSFNVANPICEGDFLAALPTTSNNGVTGIWSPALNNILTTNYLFTPTSGLCATTTNLLLTVNPKTIPTFNSIPDICFGDILLALPTTSLNGITGSWSPALDNTITTDYTFIPTLGLCTTNQTLKIVVKPIQTPTFNPILSICEGDILLALPTTSLNGIAGNWSPALNNLLTTKYFFTPNSGICANTIDLTINVATKKTPTFSPIPDLCFGDVPPTLPTVSNNGISGIWTPNIVSNIKSDIYSFIPNSNQCTNLPSPLNITVYQDIDFKIQSECVNENYVYRIVVNNSSFDFNNATINWKDENGISIGNNQEFDITNYLKNNNIIPKFPINILVSVKLMNGCNKEKSIVIDNIYCSIQKGISPNNDNKNDFFDLQLLDVKNLKIYNRYGMVVYFLGSYSKQWTGQDYNNRQLPDGTYFYEIEFNNNSEIKVGWIYLNKEIKD
ncbi:MAG: gliding motility-associated C-terminal domain-containing protein, partial [Flavobacterium sp.]|nr:gliding motility-associated C-terminal domain-containing protein [Flavobacterium sp.]